MHFHEPRLVALRWGDRNEKVPATEKERKQLCAAPAHVHSAHSVFLLLERRVQPTPNPLCGLASRPVFDVCSMFPGKLFLTWLFQCESSLIKTRLQTI